MKPVFQTRFGGIDGPREDQGNCWQAVVASILEIPLEDAFDVTDFDWENPDDWWSAWLSWLEPFGLGCMFVRCLNKDKFAGTMPPGYHMGDYKSMTLKNGENHVCVIKEGEVVHNPNPNATEDGPMVGFFVFVPLDASRLALIGESSGH